MQINLEREALLYDIANYAFVEGDIMATDNLHAQHQTQDIIAKGNIERVNRVLSLSHAECIEMLYPYSKKPLRSDYYLDNSDLAPDYYEIEVKFPKGFSSTTADLLVRLVHEYMVCRVVADWMSITNPSSYETWQRKVEDSGNKIRNSLTNRRAPILRKLRPF